MPILREGLFNPVADIIPGIVITGTDGINTIEQHNVAPFVEVLSENVIQNPLSICGIALDDLQMINDLPNTDIRFTTVEHVGNARGNTELWLQLKKEYFSEEDWQNLVNQGKVEGDYINVERWTDVVAAENETVSLAQITAQRNPVFRIHIEVTTRPLGHSNNPWTTGELAEVLFHELHIHAADFALMIQGFQEGGDGNDLHTNVENLEPALVQHNEFVGMPDTSSENLVAYRASRTRFFIRCNNNHRLDEWDKFKAIERQDMLDNDGIHSQNQWWNLNNGNPTPQHLQLANPGGAFD